MPYDEADPSDPTLLVGVQVPAGEDSELEMAYAFAEEFARLGYSEQRLLSLFHHPFYAGAYRALQSLGEKRIQSIVRETIQVWGQFRYVVEDTPSESAVDVPVESLGRTRNDHRADRKLNKEVEL